MVDKAVLLMDFDNLFSALWRQDRGMARAFAADPGVWLHRLAGDRRRWLVLRCYLNPAGWLPCEDEASGRLYFSRFRPGLTRAGFEVVDCPALTQCGSKNAADIRLVLDAVDLLRSDCRYDEFMVASGDSDFAPLLSRLRAHDRRTAIVAWGPIASAYRALADQVLDHEALGISAPVETSDAAAGPDVPLTAAVLARYREATAPLLLAALANELSKALPGAKAGKWGGCGTFTAAINSMALPGARLTAHHLWDEGRHAPPPGVVIAA